MTTHNAAARRVDAGERTGAAAILRHLLRGARLDSVTFRSVELTLGLFNPDTDKNRDRPGYVWLSTAAEVRIDPVSSRSYGDPAATHQAGSETVARLHALLGDSVAATAITTDGALELRLSHDVITVRPGEVALDDIWTVSSDTPGILGEHRWRVTLADSGRLVLKQPRHFRG